MESKNPERVLSTVLPVAKRVSLVFVVWVASIVACVYAPEQARAILIVAYYVISVSLYFFAVQLDESMQNAGYDVRNKTKGTFWFIVNLTTAFALHYLFFWDSKPS
jgi:4-hydroxybenzoate polyprenyltransferase